MRQSLRQLAAFRQHDRRATWNARRDYLLFCQRHCYYLSFYLNLLRPRPIIQQSASYGVELQTYMFRGRYMFEILMLGYNSPRFGRGSCYCM